MTKSFNRSKKPCLWPIFGPFSQILGEKIFFQKIWLSHTTSYGFLASCQNSEKTNNTNPRKQTDRRTDGRTGGGKDRQTVFYRTLPATAGGSKKNNKMHVFYGKPKSALVLQVS